MKNLVFESLDELFEAKKADQEEDKPKPENIAKAKAKIEKSKPTKLKKQPVDEKAKQAIAGLKTELAKAKKPGAFKMTVTQKNAKIKELETKIAAWEKKLEK